MSTYKLQTAPALDVIQPEDFATFLNILAALGVDTAHPEVLPIYEELIKNLATFGSCAVACALFIADRELKGERWWAVLVRDEEFPEGHPLAEHWVVTNGKIFVDLTVADQEKEVIALGSEAEAKLVRSYETDGHTFKRLQSGLDKFRGENGQGLNMSARELYAMIYKPLLTQAVRPSQRIRVVPAATLASLKP